MIQGLYPAALAATSLVGLWIAYTAWRHRSATGSDLLGWMALATAIWAGGTIGLILASTPGAELRWLQVSYLGIVAAPITYVLLAFVYTGYERYASAMSAVLGGVGAIFLLFVWTNSFHRLYWAEINYTPGVPEGISTTPGPGFWAFVVFTYLLLFVGSVLFVRYTITAPRLYRIQTAAILVAVIAPWGANIPHALQFMTADLTPIALSITVLALWVAMFRYRLSEIGPVALRTVFENIPAGVYVLDDHDRVVDLNDTGKELFDVSGDVIGTQFRELVGERISAYVQASEDDSETIEVDPVGTDEELPRSRYYEIDVTPIAPTYTRRDRRIVVITDVTEAKRRQQRLEAQNERLDEFASIVSHDLRNPLSVANGRLELSMEECDSEHLEHVEAAHDRIGTLIDGLLTLAREGESVTDPEPVELRSLARECWGTVVTADATLAVSIEAETTILADRDRLKQLFENLFRNAIEHAGEDVTVTVGQNDHGFYVEDDGPGVPESERRAVFEAGYSTRDDGTGLGLRIVEQIADAHGWAIEAKAGTDGGARFEISGVSFVSE